MNHERTHLDLFTGIGGFALAAQANGVMTIAHVEIDEDCSAFLKEAWPNAVGFGLSPRILEALGNAICWPVAAAIIEAMIQSEA